MSASSQPGQTTQQPGGTGKKRIVICCDGTGNDFTSPNPDIHGKGGENSNVIKFYTALTIDNDQVGYYHPGVGTMGSPAARNSLERFWTKIKGMGFGAGFRDNLFDAYCYLMEVYNDNGGNGNQDEVYIVGFSRGAYTARALAGLLQGYGLLCRGNEGHLPYAWRMYVSQHDTPDKHQIDPDFAFRDTYSHKDFKIHFVGVWDTVSSIGWIYTPLRLLNMGHNACIVHARHAISIDERRCFFENNLWGDPLPGQDLVQAWFPGVHSDVGGSYLQCESALSNVALKWMLAEAEKAGIKLHPQRSLQVLGTQPPAAEFPELLYKTPDCADTPEAATMHNSMTCSWYITEILPHLYYNIDGDKEYRRVPLGLRSRQLPAGSLVHETVYKRLKYEGATKKYAPRNISWQELTLADGPDDPRPADGTTYYRFQPKDRGKQGSIFTFFDRFIVTWFFGIVAPLIILPTLLWVLCILAAAIGTALVAGTATIVHHAPHWAVWIAQAFMGCVHHLIGWYRLLICVLVSVVHWLWNLRR